MKLTSVSLILFGLASAVGNPARASDFHSPRTAALGGAGHAGPLLNDAIYLNPSFASFMPTYAVGFHYGSYSKDADHGRNYSVQIEDGRNEFLQAGFAYTLREDGSLAHLGVSRTILQRLGLGLSGKYYFDNVSHKSGQELVFSATGIIGTSFQTAFIIDNLLESDSAKQRGLYREFTIGTKLNLQQIVLVYFDPHTVPNLPNTEKMGYEAGLEFVVMSDLFFRLGMFKNSNVPLIAQYGRGFGTGLGWVAPRISLDYGLERVLGPRSFTAHTFGATIYF